MSESEPPAEPKEWLLAEPDPTDEAPALALPVDDSLPNVDD